MKGKNLDTRSRLLTLDIWLKSELKEDYLKDLDSYILNEFTVLKISKHDFEPIGLTKTYILSESHCAIHTYPENNFLSFDLFICNESINLENVIIDIVNMMPVQRHQSNILRRGVLKESSERISISAHL